MVILK